MPLSMEELKAAFKKPTTTSNQNSGFWNQFYPFYKMDFDAIASFRFLPDLDELNPRAFIVENHYHEVTVNGKKKKYACLKMYGHDDCPMCAESRKHYAAGDETLGKMFYRKIDYIAQGLVTSSPFDYPIKPEENPVRLISLSSKLYDIIAGTIGDLDETPYDLVQGRDFRIKKTRQGEWANYTTSAFSMKSTPVDAAILENPAFKLFNLNDFRYAKVDKDKLKSVIESVMTGKSLDDDTSAPSTYGHVTGNATLDKQLNAPSEAKPLAEAPAVVAAASTAAPAPAAEGQSPAERAKAVLERIRRNQAAS